MIFNRFMVWSTVTNFFNALCIILEKPFKFQWIILFALIGLTAAFSVKGEN